MDILTTYFLVVRQWTCLSGRQDRDVVLVDDSGLLLDELRAALLLQVLARQPEQDVLLAVLAAQEGPEHLATLCKIILCAKLDDVPNNFFYFHQKNLPDIYLDTIELALTFTSH